MNFSEIWEFPGVLQGLKFSFEPLNPTIVAEVWAGAELWIKDALCPCTQRGFA